MRKQYNKEKVMPKGGTPGGSAGGGKAESLIKKAVMAADAGEDFLVGDPDGTNPEYRKHVDIITSNAMLKIHKGDSSDGILALVNIQKDRNKGVARVVETLMVSLYEGSKKQGYDGPPEAFIDAMIKVIEEIALLAETEENSQPFTERDLKEITGHVVGHVIDTLVKTGGMDQDQLIRIGEGTLDKVAEAEGQPQEGTEEPPREGTEEPPVEGPSFLQQNTGGMM